MNRGGIRASHYRPLSQENIENIHHAALEVVSSVGLNVHSEKCRQTFKSVGATVEGKRVKIPVPVVEDAIKSAPSSITSMDATEQTTTCIWKRIESILGRAARFFKYWI